MRLSAKLLGFINRAFSKDPDGFLALRLRYDGAMRWTVADGWLTTAVTGGTGAPLAVDLSAHTVGTLAGFLSLQPGYAVPYAVGAGQAGAAALRLLDGTGDPATSNGDHLVAYGSILHAWIDAMAVELAAAEDAIQAMPDEMAVTTAHGDWIDYQGSFYGTARKALEPDGAYAGRIIADVLRPKGNNVAIEAAVASLTGQSCTITDVVIFRAPAPLHDGKIVRDGTYHHQQYVLPVYGLFDASAGYDLISGDIPSTYGAGLRAVINRLRDAGTQLRNIVLAASALRDVCPLPGDEPDTLIVNHLRHRNGLFRHDGAIDHSGRTQDIGRIAGAEGTVPLPTQLLLRVLVNGVPVGVLVEGEDLVTSPVDVDYDASRVN